MALDEVKVLYIEQQVSETFFTLDLAALTSFGISMTSSTGFQYAISTSTMPKEQRSGDFCERGSPGAGRCRVPKAWVVAQSPRPGTLGVRIRNLRSKDMRMLVIHMAV